MGRLLQTHLGGELFQPWLNNDVLQKDQFRSAYPFKPRWLLVMACGIAVRFLDGLPQDKHTDPAVVVLDEGGHFAIPLLAGHEGGGNALAYQVANCVGAIPVITTATDALKPLVVGIGCRKGVSVSQIEQAVLHALDKRTIAEIREVATIDLKSEEPGLLAFCNRYGIPLRVISREAVAARPWVTLRSEWVMQSVHVEGVCEPCALLTSPRGELLVPKTTRDGVAVAVVEDRINLTLMKK
ncbi:MAG: cobalamin biosynthesis protein CbiG [Ferrovum sp.]|nr:cobalamin biosynthesis protein CbiG [Ferrovum sp.]